MLGKIVQFGLHQVRQVFHDRPALLPEGSRAPDFAVADESGTVRRLGDYRGKKIVLWFFIRASTPG